MQQISESLPNKTKKLNTNVLSSLDYNFKIYYFFDAIHITNKILCETKIENISYCSFKAH